MSFSIEEIEGSDSYRDPFEIENIFEEPRPSRFQIISESLCDLANRIKAFVTNIFRSIARFLGFNRQDQIPQNLQIVPRNYNPIKECETSPRLNFLHTAFNRSRPHPSLFQPMFSQVLLGKQEFNLGNGFTFTGDVKLSSSHGKFLIQGSLQFLDISQVISLSVSCETFFDHLKNGINEEFLRSLLQGGDSSRSLPSSYEQGDSVEKAIEEIESQLAENRKRLDELDQDIKGKEEELIEVRQQEVEQEMSLSLADSWIRREVENQNHISTQRQKLNLLRNECNLFSQLEALKSDNIPDEKTFPYNKEQFMHILKETFGTLVGSRVALRYNLCDLDKNITYGTAKKILIGVGATVKVADLEVLFSKIKKPEDLEKDPSFDHDFLTISEKEELKNVESFDKLTGKQLEILLKPYRKWLSELKIDTKDFPTSRENVFVHDLESVEKFSEWNGLTKGKNTTCTSKDQLSDAEFFKLGIAEHVGKTLPYQHLRKGDLFPLQVSHDDSSPVFYQVEDQFGHNGLVPYLYTPVNKKQSLSDDAEDIFLVFRGTSTGTQWYRNFDWRGVGKNTFMQKKEAILKMCTNYLEKTDSENVTLNLTGHSLGGCDTQRAFAIITEAIAQSDDNSPFRKIKKIITTTHNAPRPDPSVNRTFKDAVKKIKEKQIDLKIDLTHIRYFDHTCEDIVSRLGEVLVGADRDNGSVHRFEEELILNRQLIDITIDKSYSRLEGILPRHTYRAFNSKRADIDWEITKKINGKEHSNELDQVLARDYHWNPDEYENMLKLVFSSSHWYSKSVFQMFINIVHLNLNYTWGSLNYLSGRLAGTSSEAIHNAREF